MTKFVSNEVLGDSTFVSVYDPESGDTGYVRMGDLVSKSETTVTATTDLGGGIELAISGKWRALGSPGYLPLNNPEYTDVTAEGDRIVASRLRDMRATRARLHVREETPFYTGPRVTVADLVARQR